MAESRDSHGDLYPSQIAYGQIPGFGSKITLQSRQGGEFDDFAITGPLIIPSETRQPDILLDGQSSAALGYLEGPHNAQIYDFMGTQSCNVSFLEEHFTPSRHKVSGDDVKKGRLPGPIRSYDAGNNALDKADVDRINRYGPPKCLASPRVLRIIVLSLFRCNFSAPPTTDLKDKVECRIKVPGQALGEKKYDDQNKNVIGQDPILLNYPQQFVHNRHDNSTKIGPDSVPTPPIMHMTKASTDICTSRFAGATILITCAYRKPAAPASMPLKTNIFSLTLAASIPQLVGAISLLWIARRIRPVSERIIRQEKKENNPDKGVCDVEVSRP